MRMPRMRFTVRRLLAAVAILGLIFGATDAIRRRESRFRNLAGYHWRKCPSRFGGYNTPHYQWHSSLAEKYRLAATRPWLPVAPDPPPPRSEAGEQPCLCGHRLPPDDRGLREDINLLCEFLEREGWEISCSESMVVGGTFYANAERDGWDIEADATTEDEAWRKLFDKVRSAR